MDVLQNDVKPVHSTQFQARQTTRRLVVSEIRGKITEKVIEPTTTEYVVSIVLASRKDELPCFFVDFGS